jgi:hypothetical protein
MNNKQDNIKRYYSSIKERDEALLKEAITNLALAAALMGKTIEVKLKDIIEK